MKATKQELIEFLERRVFVPAYNHPRADATIRRRIQSTRMRLNKLATAEQVEHYFWSAMATDRGIDSYDRISAIGAETFEDVRADFKRLCGH